MCTVVLLRRPGHVWPVLIGANRDEMRTRPWRPPGRHWPDRAHLVAGRDELSGGSWLGVNDDGVVCGILNRVGSLGPAPDKRTRGELVLEALDHADAAAAAKALADIDGSAYRSFNMLIADAEHAYWLRNEGRGDGEIDLFEVPEGLSVFTAHDVNDPASPRIRRALPRLRVAEPPDPAAGDWSTWTRMLADRTRAIPDEPGTALNIESESGFGTVSSSLIALPKETGAKPIWLFAPGPPDRAAYGPVELATRSR